MSLTWILQEWFLYLRCEFLPELKSTLIASHRVQSRVQPKPLQLDYFSQSLQKVPEDSDPLGAALQELQRLKQDLSALQRIRWLLSAV